MFAWGMYLHFVTFVFIELFPNCRLGIENRRWLTNNLIFISSVKYRAWRAELDFSKVEIIGVGSSKAHCAGRDAEYLGCMDWWYDTSYHSLLTGSLLSRWGKQCICLLQKRSFSIKILTLNSWPVPPVYATELCHFLAYKPALLTI